MIRFTLFFQCKHEMALLLAMDNKKLEEVTTQAAEELESLYAFAEKNNKLPSSAEGKSRLKFSLLMENISAVFPTKKAKRKKDEIFIVCKVSIL